MPVSPAEVNKESAYIKVVAEVDRDCLQITAQELLFFKALLCEMPDGFNPEIFFPTNACDGNKYYPIS